MVCNFSALFADNSYGHIENIDSECSLARVEDSRTLQKYLALDCEMVGVGPTGKENALARVVIINYFEEVIYDTYVKPKEPVTEYRTHITGITKENLEEALPFELARRMVQRIIKGYIIVGHALENDFKVLGLEHPPSRIRDTAYAPFLRLRMSPERLPSLQTLLQRILPNQRYKAHDPIDDARGAMMLYLIFANFFEEFVRRGYFMCDDTFFSENLNLTPAHKDNRGNHHTLENSL